MHLIETIFTLPPIYRGLVNDLTEIQNELEPVVNSTKLEYIRDWGKTVKLSTSTFKEDFISENGLNLFGKEIDKHVEMYAMSLGLRTKVTNRTSWLTCCEKDDYSHIHTHGMATISGCYYYKTADQNSGNIFFYNPAIRGEQSLISGNKSYTIIPSVGLLILFPSWYQHGVTRNESDESRISLAFNYYLESLI